jgi:SAM-dependent methyltransferase
MHEDPAAFHPPGSQPRLSGGALEHAGYVLGTHDAELERLGIQHRLWSAQAFACWERAGIGLGSRVLDVGSGPGFTSLDLAALVGPSGHVTAVDESARYIEALHQRAETLKVAQLTARVMDAQRIDLEPSSFDAAYARWMLFFVKDPAAVIDGVARVLRPGGVFAVQDYVTWEAIRLSPASDVFDRAMSAVLTSFRQSGGDTQIGLRLPQLMRRHGLRVETIRSLQRVARSSEPLWAWPSTFFLNYIPLLVERGLLTTDDQRAFVSLWEQRSNDPDAFLWAPAMLEIVARRE